MASKRTKRSDFDDRIASAYPGPVNRLVSELAALPGIGRRSAERMAFHILKASAVDAARLARAIDDVKKTVKHCAICFNFTDDKVCAICDDARRDASMLMVVEQPRDLIAMEFTGMFRGVYHVLMGRLSPLEGVGPEELTISELLRRARDPAANSRGEPVSEVILALNPTLESDGTALFLARELKPLELRVTRLGRGLATGSNIELAGKAVLADAIEGRQAM